MHKCVQFLSKSLYIPDAATAQRYFPRPHRPTPVLQHIPGADLRHKSESSDTAMPSLLRSQTTHLIHRCIWAVAAAKIHTRSPTDPPANKPPQTVGRQPPGKSSEHTAPKISCLPWLFVNQRRYMSVYRNLSAIQ